jgi:hypothetical protein
MTNAISGPDAARTPGGTAPSHTRTTCRGCGGRDLRRFLSLGPSPLANAFLESPDEFAGERRYPLDVHFCHGCSLVQLLEVVDPEVLFGHYLYVTGTSDTIAAHNQRYAQAVVERLGLSSADLVVEVASNNGHLLRGFQAAGTRVLGVEPARNLAELANANGVPTINRFFDASVARLLRETEGPARVVIANNVLAHVDDTVDFLAGCAALVEDDGLVVIEVPYLVDLIAHVEFDTVYHEHLCYFSVTALTRVCEAAGLSIVDVERVSVHGGSVRIFAGRRSPVRDHAPQVITMAADERAAGLTRFDTYAAFASLVATTRQRLVELLASLRREGGEIAAYGAPAKGNTLLNYCGIDTRLVSFTVDKNPLKVGLYTPGTHLPVRPVEALLERQPAYVLILAWNFADEIMAQQHEYARRGGRFIVPIPEPKLVA